MKKITISILKDEIIRLQVKTGEETENRIEVVKENESIEQIDISKEITEDINIAIGDAHELSYLKDRDQIKVHNRITNELVFATQPAFVLQKEKELGISLDYAPDEVILGLGQDHMGNLDQRNTERIYWHQNNLTDSSSNATIPFYLSSRGYGLYAQTSYPMRIAFGKPKIPDRPSMADLAPSPFDWFEPCINNPENSVALMAWEDPMVDVFIMLGNYEEIIKKYYSLTGTPGTLPKWSLGYIQCKNRYRSADEILNIARKFRHKQLPCDCIVLDWKWFKQFGDLEWDERYFANMKEVLEELRGMGIKVMQAQHPMIEKDSLKYDQFLEEGLIGKCGEGITSNFDHFHPKAKKAWWKEIEKFYDDGIRAYWTDMGEPKTDYPGSEMSAGKREKYHNYYTYYWSKNLYEAQTESKKSRPFILARTQSPGIQKYNTALWNSDVAETWDIYRKSITQVQQVSISGMPYWCTDIGGFIPTDEFSPELYIRWHSWGIFCPLFRTHGTKPENEPWSYGEEAEEIIRKNLNTRYRFIPYIYSGLREHAETGSPFIRPCYVDYKDKKSLEYPYQYMFGDILVSPVVEAGSRTKKTYLPGVNTNWYDLHSQKVFSGGQVIETAAPIDSIPLFLRENSILATTDPELHVKDNNSYLIEIAGEGKASTLIYEDDGETYEFEEGKFNKLLVSSDKGVVTFKNLHAGYNLESQERFLKIRYFDKQGIVLQKDVKWNITEELTVDMLSLGTEEEKEKDYLSLEVDTLDSLRDGTVNLNILVYKIYTAREKLVLEIDKPDNYYFVDSKGSQTRNIDFEQIYSNTFKLIPISHSMPQQESMAVRIKTVDGEIINETKVLIGNGFVKNWRVKTSKNEIELDEPGYSSSQMEHNPWGYVKLLDYLNIRYKGSIPWELRDYADIPQGYGKGEVMLLSPESKRYKLRLQGDTHYTCKINGEVIDKTSDYTDENWVNVELKKGLNHLSMDLSYYSDHPFTGREFGFSVQVWTEAGDEIDREILCVPVQGV